MSIAYTSINEFLDRATPGDTFTQKSETGKTTYIFRSRLTNTEMKALGIHGGTPEVSKIGRGGLMDCIRSQYHKPTTRVGKSSACYTSIIYGSCMSNSTEGKRTYIFSYSEVLPEVPAATPGKRVTGKVIEPEDGSKFNALRLEQVHRLALNIHAEEAAPFMEEPARG